MPPPITRHDILFPLNLNLEESSHSHLQMHLNILSPNVFSYISCFDWGHLTVIISMNFLLSNKHMWMLVGGEKNTFNWRIFLLPIWIKMGKYTIISYIVIFEWNIWYFKLFYYIYYIYLISYLIFSKKIKIKIKSKTNPIQTALILSNNYKVISIVPY